LRWSRSVFDLPKLKEQLSALEEKSLDPNLWNDRATAQKILKEKSALNQKLEKFHFIENKLRDLTEYFELASEEKDQSLIAEVNSEAQSLKKNFRSI
jgi:peptide chain release factor 2